MQRTIRLFDEDAYAQNFSAHILSIEEKKKTLSVILDQTLFFPEEGGQSPDRGELAGCVVQDVQEEDGVIIHTIKRSDPKASALKEGDQVEGRIDWNHRFSNMQNHTGEHILSGILYREYGYENVGFHLSENQVTFDTSGPLTKEQVDDLEKKANEVVWQNHSVYAEYPSDSILQETFYRSKGEMEGRVRLVTIEDVDVCACCAPHVKQTGEVGLIKILKSEKYKGGTRFTILCGRRALAEVSKRQTQIEELSHLFLEKQDQVVNAANRLLEENASLKEEHNRAQEERISRLAEEALASYAGTNIWIFDSGLDSIPQRNLVNTLRDRITGFAGVFVGTDTDGYRYIISGTENAQIVQTLLKTTLGAKGGGKPEMIQGSVNATRFQIESALSQL